MKVIKHNQFWTEYDTTDIVLIQDNDLVGKINISYEHDNFACINSLYVINKYKNKGYGKQLVKEAINDVDKTRVDTIFLFCKSELIPFYESFGFEICKFNATIYDEIEMHLEI